MTLTAFLLARISEDEARADGTMFPPPGQWVPDWWAEDLRWYAAHVLAECEAKRRIIEFHANWPVLVEGPQQFEQTDDAGDLSAVTLRLTRQIAWLTQQEYVKRFGTEPPTAPMLRALALPYADHPDFDPSWRVE